MKFPCYGDCITSIKVAENASKQLIELNCILAKLTRSHRYTDAVQLFDKIHSSHHLKPDHYTLSSTLTACANLCNVTMVNQLHAHAIRAGLKGYPHVGNMLLSLNAKSEDLGSVGRVFIEIKNPDAYSCTTLLSACCKLGQLGYAWHLFDQMPPKNVELWNAIITGCAENGHTEDAFHMFREMHQLGIGHDNYTFACVLSLCSPELLDFGRQVHSLVIKSGFLARTSVINTQLTMYFNCGSVADAYEIFEEAGVMVHDQITFNAMIDGLVSMGRDEEAWIMYREMQEGCLKPTEWTFVSVMSSCSSAGYGPQVHAQAIKMGFDPYTSMSNAAITMYSSCRDLHGAHMVFERLEEKDLDSWNTLISSYAQGNFGGTAILAYLQMERAGIEPDEFTIGSLLASSDFLRDC